MAAKITGASLQPILRKINDLPNYHPFEADAFSDWSMEAGDLITINRGEESYTSPANVTRMVWKGNAPTVQISSTGNKEREPIAKVSRKKYGRGSAGIRSQEGIFRNFTSEDGILHSSLAITESYLRTEFHNESDSLRSYFDMTSSHMRTEFIDEVHSLRGDFEVTVSHMRTEFTDEILAMSPRPRRVVCFGDVAMTYGLAVDYVASKPILPGPGVVFRFADTGPGIKPEFLKRMFDPYVSTKASGRGFGLATVTSIIDAHHGGIRVSSTVGIGTTFEIFLPASKTVLATESQKIKLTQSARMRRPTLPPKGGVREILVVDDDETLLKTTSILLKVLKYSVFTATGHRDALDIFRSHAPNLACVVMDANLGETDAVRLLGSFRAIAPGVPVIISSGYAPERIRAQFVTQPYNAFLAKPYTLAELQESIEALHA